VNLAAGVYFFNGGVSVPANSTLSGTGVTLIFTQGAFAMQGTPTINLSAPDPKDNTVPFPGILYYQVPADTTPMVLGGNSKSSIDGTFYAPTAGNGTATGITLTGNSGGKIYADFVTPSMSLSGNPTFHSYAQLPGGAAANHAVALVE
jgi:hypothetical protein